MAEADIKQAKRKRTLANSKFTRTYNVLKENIENGASPDELQSIYIELNKAYDTLEVKNEDYLVFCDSDDEAIEKGNKVMEAAYRNRCQISLEISRMADEQRKILSAKREQASPINLRVKKLDAPRFSGVLRDFPTFVKDYAHYMEPMYGSDSYALRSSLSGKALDIVAGVDDDYNEMWQRLKITFGNPDKIVDCILHDIKQLMPVKENDHPSMIKMINVIERCWLDLRKLKLEQEMNTSTITSLVERLLPPTQKREWTLFKQSQESSTDGKFQSLLTFLIKEKHAIEYMDNSIRDNIIVSDISHGKIHFSDGSRSTTTSPPTPCSYNTPNIPIDPTFHRSADNSTLATLQHAVEDLTKAISVSGFSAKNNTKWQREKSKCWLHDSDAHEITECNMFLKYDNHDKINAIKENGACFRCLKVGHLSKACLSRKRCETIQNQQPCNKAHHHLIHDAHVKGITFHHSRGNQETFGNTILMITTVTCYNGGTVNAILDPCSNLSLITSQAAQRLSLKGKEVNLSLTKVGNVTEIVKSKEYELTIRDTNNRVWNLTVYGIDEITSNICPVDISQVMCLFENIHLSDIQRPVGKVDLLLGLDCCQLLPDKISQVGNLQLMKGPLGYCLRGRHPLLRFTQNQTNIVKANIHFTHVDSVKVIDDISKFFDIESLGTFPTYNCDNCEIHRDFSGKNITLKENRELELIKQGLNYDPVKNQWTAKYPWIRNPSDLPNNFISAYGQLKSLEKRLLKSSEYSKLYCAQMDDMLIRNVARKLTDVEIKEYKGPVHYIPHHGVTKLSSISTPLRVVFNSSASFMGHKLNDYWAKGPDVINSLLGVLLRFREDEIAINGDISKMYNTIRLESLEQHTHRYLWRNLDTSRPPDHYAALAVLFGDRPSGAISIVAMQETARLKRDTFPEAAKVIERNTYVDDILKSVPTIQDAEKLIKDIEVVLSSGGFNVKHWIVSGSSQCSASSTLNIIDTNEGSVLGMLWKPRDDTFIFKVDNIFLSKPFSREEYPVREKLSCAFPHVLTRRTVLSLISRLYDPLGILIPFTLKAKLLMREICISKSGSSSHSCWDDPVSDEIFNKCKEFFEELPKVENIAIKRSLKPSEAVGNPVLIIYCDGSQYSYGACAYIRWELSNGEFSSNLICAKNRLTPMKTLSIPRIELCAAIIACRLRTTILKELDLDFSAIFHITDSSIVRCQIQKESYVFGTFVANRIAEIQNSSKPSEWFWTASCDNIADLTTKPVPVEGIDEYWMHGPTYLMQSTEYWPINQENQIPLMIPETKKVHQVNIISSIDSKLCDLSDINIEAFSNLNKLLRLTAIILKISQNRKFICNALHLNAEDIQHALICWILFVQHGIKHDWKIRFKRLGPSLRDDGVITVGYRIMNWIRQNWDKDLLILLPSNSYFTKLVILEAHNSNHDGIDTTVAKVRRNYWIPQLPKLVKKVRNSCYQCRILDKKLCEQKMGQLPIERLKPSPPFYYTGVDLFGPILIKDAVKKRTKMKSYGVIFNCFTTRAIYLDVACSYDTDSFLLVLRRFITIHGCPKQIRSDAGSQIVAAEKEWSSIFGLLKNDKVNNFATQNGMDWIVNKSADAPWQNGITERLIRLVKRCITHTINTNLLTFSELQTVYFECANTLNERPIGSKDGGHTYICPNDLLLGRTSIKAPSEPLDISLNPKKRFRFIHSLLQNFWKRWQNNYFSSLILQQKWHVESRNLIVGDIVLVQSSNSLRSDWKLAEVFIADPGSDGKVRDVVLRYKIQNDTSRYTGTKDTLIHRSVHRLVLIVAADEN